VGVVQQEFILRIILRFVKNAVVGVDIKMKTLKQILQSKPQNKILTGEPLYREQDITETNIEWLTQKRQEVENREGSRLKNKWFIIYHELLEELKE
jgi:hypothetical protein